MKKYLPISIQFSASKTKSNPQGFTLIELLVVIAIIAILAVIGIALFSGVQKGARDTKRKGDITAMSKAMEVNYVAGTGYTVPLSSTWFSDQVKPTNPGPNGITYTELGPAGTGSPTTVGYTFCAGLENSTGNATSSTGAGLGASTGAYFCKKNSQ